MIDKGTPAPFSGVLLPEDAYRFYQEDIFSLEFCEEHLKEAQRPQPASWLSGPSVVALGAGLVLGFLAGARGN